MHARITRLRPLAALTLLAVALPAAAAGHDDGHLRGEHRASARHAHAAPHVAHRPVTPGAAPVHAAAHPAHDAHASHE